MASTGKLTTNLGDAVQTKNILTDNINTTTITDINGGTGLPGQLLSSTALGIDWITAGGVGVAAVNAGTNISIPNPLAPVVSLQSPLTATLNMGTQPITDSVGSIGTPSQVLTASAAGGQTEWRTAAATPDLQTVCNVGNTTTTDIIAAGLQLEDLTSTFAYNIFSTGNVLTITFNQTPTTPLTLNSFGYLILDGTQARLRLNSITVGSADYYYSQVSGATTLATYNLFYFDGTTTINPLRLNTNGTLDLGTVVGSATGINLFGVGTSFLNCANASKGNLQFFMSGDVRLTAGGVTPALLNISTLGVLSFTGASATLTLTGTGATGGTINLAGVGTSSINCTDANKGQLDFLITNEVLITAGGISPADLELTNLGILTLSRSGTGNCSLQFGGLGTNFISCNNAAKGNISFAMSNTVTITAGGATPGTMSLTNAGLLTVSGQVVCDAYRVTAASTGIGISLVGVNLVAQNSNTAFGSGNFCYVAASGNTWIAVSDNRIKHDIQPLENCLEKILLLNPVNYKMNYDNKQCVGFIAQEVLEVIPELVVVPEDPESLLGVDLTNMIVFLVKAVQEQNKLIQELRLKLNIG
jgi:hypothetical protein